MKSSLNSIPWNPFLSTLSLRRATEVANGAAGIPWYFYPRSPCGERLVTSGPICGAIAYFSPRSPCGERQPKPWRLRTRTISIHALLAESDDGSAKTVVLTLNFYPRSPCGERRPAKTA